jgi:nitrate/TMAO reductase-like tetraheme cytochrome c subunit
MLMRKKADDESEIVRPARKKDRLYILLGVFVAVGLIAFGAIEYTSSPGFCSSCHEIAPSVDGWRSSAHAVDDAATCLDCHADPGFVGEMIAHIGGLQEAYVHVTEKPTAQDIDGLVPQARCLECHDDAWDDEAFPVDHPTKESPCGVCHRDSAHTNEKPAFIPAATGGE